MKQTRGIVDKMKLNWNGIQMKLNWNGIQMDE